MNSNLVIVGLDGVRLDVVERFRDLLPTLDEMMTGGAYGDLRTVLPGPHSGPAWTSFSTGVNPGKHGIGDWRIRDGYDFSPASNEDIDVARFWDYLSDTDHTTGIFNIPLTNPPTPVDGVLVTSWASSIDTWTYPADFQDVLEDVGYQRKADFSSPDDPLENLFESIRAQRRGMEAFMDRYEWDCLVGMFYETEQAHHQLGTFLDPDHELYDETYEDKVKRVYEMIDEELGQLKSTVGDDANFIVMSDHGFHPLYERIYLNRILEEYGHYRPPSGQDDHIGSRKNLLVRVVRRIKTNSVVRKMANKGTNLPVVGAGVGSLIDRYRSAEYSKSVDANWDETAAFNGFEHGGIFINTHDMPQGIVPEQEKEPLVDEIIEDLRSDEWLSERVDAIHRREELFDGDKLHQLPEIVIDFADGYLGASGYREERYRGQQYFSRDDKNVAFHTMDGILIADGPDIASETVENASILDIAPTVLHFFSESIPENMDGTPMWQLFRDSSEFVSRAKKSRGPLRSEGTRHLTQKEQQEVESRLQEMGYK